MSDTKFTTNMKPFCDKQVDGRFNIGVEDSENTVLCYTAGGNPETRLANVTLWSVSDEMYDMLGKLIMAIKSINDAPLNPVKIHENLIRDAENTLSKARGEK